MPINWPSQGDIPLSIAYQSAFDTLHFWVARRYFLMFVEWAVGLDSSSVDSLHLVNISFSLDVE